MDSEPQTPEEDYRPLFLPRIHRQEAPSWQRLARRTSSALAVVERYHVTLCKPDDNTNPYPTHDFVYFSPDSCQEAESMAHPKSIVVGFRGHRTVPRDPMQARQHQGLNDPGLCLLFPLLHRQEAKSTANRKSLIVRPSGHRKVPRDLPARRQTTTPRAPTRPGTVSAPSPNSSPRGRVDGEPQGAICVDRRGRPRESYARNARRRRRPPARPRNSVPLPPRRSELFLRREAPSAEFRMEAYLLVRRSRRVARAVRLTTVR